MQNDPRYEAEFDRSFARAEAEYENQTEEVKSEEKKDGEALVWDLW